MTRALRRRRLSRGWLLMAFLLAIVAARFGYDLWTGRGASRLPPLVEGECRVIRVVDGDTIVVSQQREEDARTKQSSSRRLRLLGIDSPETVKPGHSPEPWGAEATAFTKEFLAKGKAHLLLDRRREDRYGRCLAYVYVDDRMLNEELVRAGLARVSAFPGDSASVTRKLKQAEEEAKEERRGIWSKGGN